jgi:hypothetical protein
MVLPGRRRAKWRFHLPAWQGAAIRSTAGLCGTSVSYYPFFPDPLPQLLRRIPFLSQAAFSEYGKNR